MTIWLGFVAFAVGALGVVLASRLSRRPPASRDPQARRERWALVTVLVLLTAAAVVYVVREARTAERLRAFGDELEASFSEQLEELRAEASAERGQLLEQVALLAAQNRRLAHLNERGLQRIRQLERAFERMGLEPPGRTFSVGAGPPEPPSSGGGGGEGGGGQDPPEGQPPPEADSGPPPVCVGDRCIDIDTTG